MDSNKFNLSCPITRTINGHPLIADIELTLDDITGGALRLEVTEIGLTLTGLEAIILSSSAKLATIETGATVGATWGSNIYSQPSSLSGINATEGSKLAGIEAGATVGAAWNTTLSGIPMRFADTPSGAGLYLSSTYMGYYSGAAWMTYMDNSGNFFLGGSSGVLQWNGSALTISATSGGNSTVISSGATAFAAGPTATPTVTITRAGVLTAIGASISTNAEGSSSNILISAVANAGSWPGIALTNSSILYAGTGACTMGLVDDDFNINVTAPGKLMLSAGVVETADNFHAGGDISVPTGHEYTIDGGVHSFLGTGATNAAAGNHTHDYSSVYAPITAGAAFSNKNSSSGIYVATSSGGPVTFQLRYTTQTINTDSHNFLHAPE